MDTNRVTVRYAKAFVEMAHEQGLLKETDHDIRMLYTALTEYAGFSDFILNPGFVSKEKFRQLKSLFSPVFHPLTLRFLEMVFQNNREEYLKDICRNSIEMTRRKSGILSASLVTAHPLAPGLIQKIKRNFEQKLKTTIEMDDSVNPDLIGGFIFTIDGEQFNASVASKITEIKKQLQLK
ncbi:MAG TPA: ATP synthase F1 subunit delta [Prolixibacteraceae bacterium]|nr:ATP synthase F1 subunit delta [Prolixibacteraceae bacterium]